MNSKYLGKLVRLKINDKEVYGVFEAFYYSERGTVAGIKVRWETGKLTEVPLNLTSHLEFIK